MSKPDFQDVTDWMNDNWEELTTRYCEGKGKEAFEIWVEQQYSETETERAQAAAEDRMLEEELERRRGL